MSDNCRVWLLNPLSTGHDLGYAIRLQQLIAAVVGWVVCVLGVFMLNQWRLRPTALQGFLGHIPVLRTI